MILVLTHSYFEQGTNPVIDWLLYYKVPFVRLCVEDLLTKKTDIVFNVEEGKVIVNGIDYIERINVVFYRRFYRYLNYEDNESLGHISRKIFYESNSELEHLTEALFKALEKKVWFPAPQMANVNKLNINVEANRAGLLVPRSVVLNSKQKLVEFSSECAYGCITKPISRISYYTFGRYTYSSYSILVNEEVLDALPSHFFPSLFQECIPAIYEIRVFYLDGEFYSTAALCTQAERAVDIKQSFNTQSLKWVTYELPKFVEESIDKFMRQIGLVTGSIDIIKTSNDKYYFLEVNPVGQYGAPSWQGGHQLDKRIAEWLIKKNNNGKK